MASWRIELLGPLRILRDGASLRPRTVQQALLVAMLATAESPLDRGALAEALWPEAERGNALAYLRRAVMELRRSGLEIEATGGGLAVDRRGLQSDVADLLQSPAQSFSLLPSARLLEGIDHPAADAVRIDLRTRLGKAQKPPQPSDPAQRNSTADLLAWIGESLIADRPEAAASILEARMPEMAGKFAMEPILEICLRTSEGASTPENSVLAIQALAARTAHLLTRYSLAERLYRKGIAEADSIGRPDLAVRNRSDLAFLLMERRRWAEAISVATRSAEEADQLGTAAARETAHANLAGIQWHLGRLEESVGNYRTAIELAPEPRKLVHRANLAYVESVFGLPESIEIGPVKDTFQPESYAGFSEAYLGFALALRRNHAAAAAVAAKRMVELSSKGTTDRLFCVALDCAAIVLDRLNRPDRAAACVRVGSRIRREVDHPRSPGEKTAILRNVSRPFFGSRISTTLGEFDGAESVELGRGISALL